MNLEISHQGFQNLLSELASSTDYKYIFLRHQLKEAMQGKSNFYNDSILNQQDGRWILIIHSEALIVYGSDWIKEQFDEIKTYFDLTKFSNYLMTGDSQLIRLLIESYKIDNYEVEMERIFYKANSVNPINDNSLKISTAEKNEVDTLAKMLQQYYHEEYHGQNEKSLAEMTLKVQACIDDETMYVLKNPDDIIVSFCTIVSPNIGILFTDKQFRNMGYGKIILAYCSNLLLRNNEEIYLMSVKSKVESNAVFRRLGFEQFFEYSYIRINKN